MKCETNLTDGVKKISETKRPGMVIIHKSTCSACNTLKPKLLASTKIDALSNSFVVISLMDEKVPNDQKWGFDGRYFPRIYFLDPNGRIMKEIMSPEGNPKFKYFYSSEKGLVQSMEKVLKVYSDQPSTSQQQSSKAVTAEFEATRDLIMRCDFKLPQGLVRMRSSQQPGMVIIYKSWCPVCSELKEILTTSREIDYLSNYIVIILLKDDDEPQDRAFAPDGSYIPRVFFLTPAGQIMYDVINSTGDPRYRYFYTGEKELAFNIRRVINFFPRRR